MKTQILVIGRHEEILQTVLRLIRQQENWEAIGTTEDEAAVELFLQRGFDLVLLGGGVEAASEQRLRAIFSATRPDTKIIQHFGGGSGLLFGEIQSALDDNPAGNFVVLDNPSS